MSDTAPDQHGTTRDKVWNSVLELLVKPTPNGFRLDTVRRIAGLETAQNQTIRRTLKAMEKMGYLQRASDQAHYWYPGPRSRQYLNRKFDGEPAILRFRDEDGNEVTGRPRNAVPLIIGRKTDPEDSPISWSSVRRRPNTPSNDFKLSEREQIDNFLKEGNTAVVFSETDSVKFRVYPSLWWVQERDGRVSVGDVNLEVAEIVN